MSAERLLEAVGSVVSGDAVRIEIAAASADIAEERIQGGSITEIDILSGSENITSWDGGAVTLELPTGSGDFEEGKGYHVIQISADRSETEHIGRCVTDGADMHVEISITHLSTFVVLAIGVDQAAVDDDTNEFLGSINRQLSLAHAYGDTPAARCRNTVTAVSGLLYGIEIDHYISLSMDGVIILNNLAGGVTEYRTLEGEPVMGETYMEYHVDEAAARELVLELFYEPAPNMWSHLPRV